MKIFYSAFLGLFFLFSVAEAKDFKFIEGLEDVPLMNGLVQNVENTISFGNEEARFVEVTLSSTKVGFKKVESFYKESLPQLGWIYQGTYNDTIVFYRDGESLSFFKESTKPLEIRITVKNRL